MERRERGVGREVVKRGGERERGGERGSGGGKRSGGEAERREGEIGRWRREGG